MLRPEQIAAVQGFQNFLASASAVTTLALETVTKYSDPRYWQQEYHNSKLSGEAWVNEVLDGHPDRILTEFGVRRHVFVRLLAKLTDMGYTISRRGVTVEEQLAIFLYTRVTGLSSRHIGERFQRSTDTITRYFKKMLIAFSSPTFYNAYVVLPSASDPVSPYIIRNPKLFPYFENCIGALDGTHITCTPSSADRSNMRNRKGFLSQNVLAVCDFEMRFLYILAGWDGSVNDTFLLADARIVDFPIPQDRYYLGDGGFPLSNRVIIPYPSKRYHLREWAVGNARPLDKEELFNLRHAQARNVVERIFGVVKRRWKVLQLPLEYDMQVQARVPAALAALHNFIIRHDPMYNAAADIAAAADPVLGIRMGPDGQRVLDDHGEIATARAESEEDSEEGKVIRDQIATRMWIDYQQYIAVRTEAQRAEEERLEREAEEQRLRQLENNGFNEGAM